MAGIRGGTSLNRIPTDALGVSIVVPTYREVENIPRLIEELSAAMAGSGLRFELLFMDDDSRDGSEELVSSLGLPWVRLIVRKHDRDLSRAVLEGLRVASHDYLVVMDGDLSHPPRKVPELIARLREGFDFVVGSRFIEGGSIGDDWGLLRWFNSRIAAWLARPLTTLRDPMSGFFALRRSTLLRGQTSFAPLGYKIGLEILVRCRCTSVSEVPIHFQSRKHGRSKLSLLQRLRYLQHVGYLYLDRYGRLRLCTHGVGETGGSTGEVRTSGGRDLALVVSRLAKAIQRFSQ